MKALFFTLLLLSSQVFAQTLFLVSEEEMLASNANKTFFYPKSTISPEAYARMEAGFPKKK